MLAVSRLFRLAAAVPVAKRLAVLVLAAKPSVAAALAARTDKFAHHPKSKVGVAGSSCHAACFLSDLY